MNKDSEITKDMGLDNQTPVSSRQYLKPVRERRKSSIMLTTLGLEPTADTDTHVIAGTVYMIIMIIIILFFLVSEDSRNWLQSSIALIDDLKHREIWIIFIMILSVPVGLPGGFMCLSFGCLMPDIWETTALVTIGLILGDSFAYWLSRKFLGRFIFTSLLQSSE